MAFWTEASSEPTRKYRFVIQTDGPGSSKGVWWWAKSVSKPSYSINSSTYQLGNHNYKYPGVLTWNDITLTIVDVGSKTEDLFKNLNKMGYTTPDKTTPGIGKSLAGSIDEIMIQQVAANGDALEIWTLYNVVVSEVTFGDLSYGDDDIVEIGLTLVYDYANLKKT